MLSHITALIAVLGTGIIYGTDTFSALVLRPAIGRVDDAALLSVMGNVHRYGDRRLPAPGIIGILGAATASVFAALAGHPTSSALAGAAFVLLVLWLVLYLRMSPPINRVLAVAAAAHDTSVDARALQHDWDRTIVLRATLQGLAVAALCASQFS